MSNETRSCPSPSSSSCPAAAVDFQPPPEPPPLATVLQPLNTSPPRSYLYALTHNPNTFSAPSLSDAQQLPNINLQSNSSHQKPSRPIPPLNPNNEPSSSLSDEAIARLRRFHPNHVHIPQTLLDEGSRQWKQSLVGKFLGRPLFVDKVFEGLDTG